MAGSKVIRIRTATLDAAHRVARKVLGRRAKTNEDALAVAVYQGSDEALEKLAAAVNARQQALVIVNTVAAIKKLTGEDVEVLIDGRGWWLRLDDQSAFLGEADPDAVATEMAKLGAECVPNFVQH